MKTYGFVSECVAWQYGTLWSPSTGLVANAGAAAPTARAMVKVMAAVPTAARRLIARMIDPQVLCVQFSWCITPLRASQEDRRHRKAARNRADAFGSRHPAPSRVTIPHDARASP